MEPEGSVSCSHQPAIGPHPEPDESSPSSHSISIKFVIKLFSHLRLGLPTAYILHYLEVKAKRTENYFGVRL
jgi:hypothetical protein